MTFKHAEEIPLGGKFLAKVFWTCEADVEQRAVTSKKLSSVAIYRVKTSQRLVMNFYMIDEDFEKIAEFDKERIKDLIAIGQEMPFMSGLFDKEYSDEMAVLVPGEGENDETL